MAISGCNQKIMAARCVRRAIYLALDVVQPGLSAVLCVIEWVSADCRLASWCFGAGANLQRQTLLSSGDTVCEHRDKGHLRA